MSARRKPGTEDDDILMRSIGPAQHITQVMQAVWVTDRDKNVSRTGTDQCVVELRIIEYAKLFERFRLTGLFALGVVLRDGENPVKYPAEDHSGDGCVLLGQKISDRDQKQYTGDQRQPHRYFMPA